MKRDPEEYLDSDEYILSSGAAERIKQPADYTALLALMLWNVENPLIVSAHISKYAGTKLHVLDYIGEERPTDDRFFDD